MIQALRLTVAVLLVNFSTSTSVESNEPLNVDYTDQCMEELQLNTYSLQPAEQERNRTCLTKCTFEKEGKIDSEGNIVVSKFPSFQQKSVKKCLKLIEIDDLCKRSEKLMSCVDMQTDDYWRMYDVCDEFLSYSDDSDLNCFYRCQMIVDGNLLKDGSVNISAIIIEPNPNNTVTNDEAFKICSEIITDEDACVRDLNMYYCVSYVIIHSSEELMKKEIRCGKETKIYPFDGTDFKKDRTCFDRCVLIASGDWDPDNPMKSHAFKNVSQVKVEEAFNTCKMTLQETDRCTKDMYFYDCVKYVNSAESDYIKNELECSLESKTPLINFRNDYEINPCKARCMWIKEGQMDKEGNINRTVVEQFTINSTLVDQTLEFCNLHKKGNSCIEDASGFIRAISTVQDLVMKLCNAKEDSCYNRCMMIHIKQLDLNGEILVDSLLINENVGVDVIKKAIKNCKASNQDKHYCARDVDTHICASSEVLRLHQMNQNKIDNKD